MYRKQLPSLLFVTFLCGCATTRGISEPAIDAMLEPKFLATTEDIDAIQIEELTITGRNQVSRFMKVCRNANWAPFAATLPKTIYVIQFMSNGTETHKLLYAGGWLIDTNGDGTPRFGTIHAGDGDWFFDNVDTKLMLLRNAL